MPYAYVGPLEIVALSRGRAAGALITTHADLLRWLGGHDNGVATFVIDPQGRLRLADRRSEHVACAGGSPVLSAGEMFFHRQGERVVVVEVSNQSTGYCPRPESWPTVAAALDRIGVAHPGDFTLRVNFRRCEACGERNIVKDEWYHCAVCATDLPQEWNFA